MKNFNQRLLRGLRLAGGATAVLAAAAAGTAWSQSAGLADAPLFTSSATQVKPNIMFIMDDSGSMARNYLPDAAGNFGSDRYGRYSSQCNGVAYNHNVVYSLPVDYTGTPVAAAPNIYKADPTSTTSKRSVDGDVTVGAVGTNVRVEDVQGRRPGSSWYDVGELVTVYTSDTKFIVGTVVSWDPSDRELWIKVTKQVGSGTMSDPTVGIGEPASSEYTYYKYKGSQPRLDFSYDSNGSVTANTFYNQCNYTIGSTSGKAVFDEIKVNGSSAEAQNYANWYTYYRTRMSMMKSSISLAFKGLDDKYRIGYSTISEEGVADGDDFLNIRDFKTGSGEQKQKFYEKFNAAEPVSWTPLRAALSKAGKYYAKKVKDQGYDPVQYSCQRNFTILSTDGFWNTNDESTTYGPLGLDGKNVGDVDGALARPMLDSNKSSNTLADVAAYYYQTDLRTSGLGNCTGSLGAAVDVCANNVSGKTADVYRSFGDAASWQHMTTFTLGLGVAGTLDFNKDYQTLRSGDFHKIVNRELNWPTPAADKPSAVDDLWHAAVNGRGQYFSAGDPASLSAGLNNALASIQAVVGSASAASTSSLQPVAGDNDIYVAQFTTQEWVGDVLAFKIDPNNGSITTEKSWSAKEKLDAKDWTTRKIYYPQPGATLPTLRAFNYTNLKADGLNSHFDNFCAKTGAGGIAAPLQCDLLGVDDKPLANNGEKLVNFLAGDQSMTYYRTRTARLGDIINASPLFIGKPQFKYQDTGYQDYVTAKAGRTSVVLAAANDGMLHAFARATGEELWAFVPSFVIPSLYKLADSNFMNAHSYYVDGSPQVGDVQVGGVWKTIVIGGMNKGGRGYYALDMTDPGNPKLLWEFRHKDLGYSYGNPIITKRTSGEWVVVFGSGYDNNVDAGLGVGDGNGHLFVLNAWTGEIKEKVSTFTDTLYTVPAGTAAAPNGFAKVNNWVVTDADNTSLRFYGGDLLGNVWRFDIDSQVAPNKKALRLAQLKNADDKVQPVTVKPALAEVSYNGQKFPVVYVPTGSYIRTTDPLDKNIQSMYAIKDPLTNTAYGNIRTRTDFVKQTITAGLDASKRPTRTSTFTLVDWPTKGGWYQDFPVGGERVSVNPQLALETLFVGSNLPSADACSIGGESFLYEFNITDGSFASTYVGGVLVQGLTVVQLTTGAAAGSIVTIITRSDGSLQTDVNAPVNPAASLKRTSWRELVD